MQKPDLAATVRRQIGNSLRVVEALFDDGACHATLARLTADCVHALRSGAKVIFAGNGGSFADAQHLAAEFVCRFQFDRGALAALALGTNASTFSAIGNDYGFDRVFARELSAMAKRNDVFIGMSTSGNSANIIAALEVAKEMGLKAYGLTGADGGKLTGLCECIRVPSASTRHIQECHIIVGHIVCDLVESTLFPGRS